jgi:hypothetical protein
MELKEAPKQLDAENGPGVSRMKRIAVEICSEFAHQ